MNKQERFAQFTERARQVFDLAYEEACHFQHNYLGTEHILLGLMDVEDGLAVQILRELDLNAEKLRAATLEYVGKGKSPEQDEIKMTADVHRVIELALAEAQFTHRSKVDTEHLLAGLLRLDDCDATHILLNLGIQPHMTRIKIFQAQEQGTGFTFEKLASEKEQIVTRMRGEQARVTTEGTPRNRFDKFSERARKVLSLAQEEAQRFQHNYIGTEHLLLGLVREGQGVAAKVLENMGVELSQIRQTIEYIIGRGERMVIGELGLTPRAKKVIELAVDEARRLNHHYIGTEHILLGLVREGQGIAANVLECHGVSLQKTREETINVLTTNTTHKQQEALRDKLSTYHFDEHVEQALRFAQSLAYEMRHGYVGSGHILIGLLQEEEGKAARVLHKLGVDSQQARHMFVTSIGYGIHVGQGDVPLTPRAGDILQHAQEIAPDTIDTEHLLASLVEICEGDPTSLVDQLHLTSEAIREKLAEEE
jgi:ATP-dependent Clp protease ATP-binding subunit ClpA